jgi:hypothetical protein
LLDYRSKKTIAWGMRRASGEPRWLLP